MDLTQLEMFNAVAEAGSITRLQQSASRAVESHYPSTPAGNRTGVDLFIRENQRLRLSPAGHNFYAIANKFSR